MSALELSRQPALLVCKGTKHTLPLCGVHVSWETSRCVCGPSSGLYLWWSALQELADAVNAMLHGVSHCLLKGEASVPLAQCLPYLTKMADAWTAYACSQEEDTPASNSPDLGEAHPCHPPSARPSHPSPVDCLTPLPDGLLTVQAHFSFIVTTCTHGNVPCMLKTTTCMKTH